MNRSQIFLLSAFMLVLGTSRLFAITDEEIFRNFPFAFVNPGARSTGMGGAFIGLADDATASEANPAGLTILTKPEVSFEYRNVQFDSSRLNSANDIGGGISFFSLNDLQDLNRPS